MASVPASTMLPREVSVNMMGAGGRDPERREARETLRGTPYRAPAHGSSLGRSHSLVISRHVAGTGGPRSRSIRGGSRQLPAFSTTA